MKTITLFSLIFTFSFHLFAGGKAQEVVTLATVSLPYVHNAGIAAAAIAKEGCSCLFVSDLAEYSNQTDSYEDMIEECSKRASLPFFKVIADNVEIKIVKTNRTRHLNKKYGHLKLVTENWAVNKLTFRDLSTNTSSENPIKINTRTLLQRFEAVLDKDSRYGCRMRQTYDFDQLGINRTYYGYRKTRVDGKLKTGKISLYKNKKLIDLIAPEAKTTGINAIYTQKAEMPVPKDWPKTIAP